MLRRVVIAQPKKPHHNPAKSAGREDPKSTERHEEIDFWSFRQERALGSLFFSIFFVYLTCTAPQPALTELTSCVVPHSGGRSCGSPAAQSKDGSAVEGRCPETRLFSARLIALPFFSHPARGGEPVGGLSPCLPHLRSLRPPAEIHGARTWIAGRGSLLLLAFLRVLRGQHSMGLTPLPCPTSVIHSPSVHGASR
jgi:hypothetical protein